eukprot:UN07304
MQFYKKFNMKMQAQVEISIKER